ncbi:MAG: hypothetical protein Fur0021_28870 [Candidatus Promineifilaceae bacterium]
MQQAAPAGIQELVTALADENETIRWMAASGLRQIGGVHVAGVLQAFIQQTNNPIAREEAEKTLQLLS